MYTLTEMRLGFTGTRHGMTDQQKRSVRLLINALKPSYFNHGDCVGADVEAHDIVRDACPKSFIYVYPAIDREQNRESDYRAPPDKPLTRNRVIVDMSDVMIATPRESSEMLRGGTWSTVRYARLKKKSLYLILPNGTAVKENVGA